jgi:uncharacterized protein (DUF427 family)
MQKNPSHYATVNKLEKDVEVRIESRMLARSSNALQLVEHNDSNEYPAVIYIPIEDIDYSNLHNSDTESSCPIKGKAKYKSYKDNQIEIEDIAWYYPEPQEDIKKIKDHLAFFTDKVNLKVL